MSSTVLHQFEFSHFNEKARWALDYTGVRYEKNSLLPGFHIPEMLWRSGQRQLPVLEENGHLIPGSGAIIAHLEETHPEPPLYPSEPRDRQRALEIARWFDETLGPAIRRAFFHDLLADEDAVRLFTLGRTDTAAGLYRALFPVTRNILRFDLGITEEAASADRDITAAGFERIARDVGSGGYLVGNRFSVADLTAAALLSPAVMPPEFPVKIPAPRPPALVAWTERWSAHPGGQWVLETYRRHRAGARPSRPTPGSPR